ncbi:hypothetical protein MYCTH_2112425 [Thermothelomyces thermophilus ATCC 42464]|uniref:Uncharacterized protein n=1 Tax=Thermothelomyces thermophilus (strain ATCC 42464 / BCRC 31852 / DSM 1799) TaxID=573729 RepID=G2QIG4_THET4|nr:uncharacterized protein MYCTH_2112425 [Thermothelomyces thermophilus ATCC 42464]AEO60338.1 hypothetical protein MYCTH_2112425 [Thermothelomyces thermophilus ATCC 42464]
MTAFGLGSPSVPQHPLASPSIESQLAAAQLVGDRAYTYENLRKYYEHSFNFGGEISSARLSNTTPSFDRADVGTGGQVPISFPLFAQSWSTWAAKGFEAVGIKPITALLHGELLGSTWQIDSIDSSTSPSRTRKMEAAIAQFNEDRTGPLASPGGDFYAGERLPAQLKSRLSSETKKGPSVQATVYVLAEKIADDNIKNGN